MENDDEISKFLLDNTFKDIKLISIESINDIKYKCYHIKNKYISINQIFDFINENEDLKNLIFNYIKKERINNYY